MIDDGQFAMDERRMRQALELARCGEGATSPNPMVGCLIVAPTGEVVGRGWHEYGKRDHAEVIALREAGDRARGATAYVTLEPCSHTGRTGPCAEALLRAGVARVVCAMQDPNPIVNGRGIDILRRAGVEVEAGLCEPEARALNAAFARRMRSGLPLVTLKNSLSLDGRISPAPADRHAGVNYLSGPETLAEVHRLRHAADAILIGVGTALNDNPQLTDRSGRRRARPLLRVVLDSHLRLPLDSRLAASAANDLLVLHTSMNIDKERSLAERGAELVRLPADAQGRVRLDAALHLLGERGACDLLVEGGSHLNRSFLAEGLADRMLLFYAPRLLGEDAAPLIDGDAQATLPRPIRQRSFALGADLCLELWLRDPYA